MPRYTRIAHFFHYYFFQLLWLFLMWVSFRILTSDVSVGFENIIAGSIFFGFAMSGFSFSVAYLITFEILGRLFRESLGSLLFFKPLQRMYKCSLSGSSRYQTIRAKYSEWIRNENVQDRIIPVRNEINRFMLSVLCMSLIFYVCGLMLI